MPFIPCHPRSTPQRRDPGVFGAGRPALALGGWPAAARRGDGALRAPTADSDETKDDRPPWGEHLDDMNDMSF